MEPARRARRWRRCAARADRRLRPLRLLPADVPDLRALARGDGLAARADPPDGAASSTARSRSTDTVVEHFDRCLGCMACVTACPSGVQYDRLIEQTRALRRDATTARPGRRAAAAALRSSRVFPHRRRLRAALALRRAAGARAAPRRSAAARAAVASAGLAAGAPARRRAPRVALLAGCVQSVVFGDVNAATARVLAADGYDVARAARAGLLRRAARPRRAASTRASRARARSSDALAGYDHIVTNAAGCGSHLKDHGSRTSSTSRSCSREPAPAPRAERHPLALRVAFQDSCHLRHAQRRRSRAARRARARSPA